MITENKNIDQFSGMVENIKKPFLIIEKNGSMSSYNKEAVTVFNINNSSNIFLHYLEQNCAAKFTEIFADIFSTDRSFDERINIKLINGLDFFAKVHIIPSYIDENDKVLLVMIIPEIESGILKNYMKMSVSFDDLPKKIRNKRIVSLIEEIKTIYPFTFIGKQKIQREIDEMEELFWIVDTDSNFVMVNKSFSKAFGLKQSFFLGKNQKDFVPPYLIDFFVSIQKFINDNLNLVVIEGLPFMGVNISEEMQVIEIPIGDSENNLIAMVGIAQKKLSESDVVAETVKNKIISEFVKSIPSPVAVADAKGIIKQCNEKFKKILFLEQNSDNLIYFGDIFDRLTSGKIEEFIAGNNETGIFETVISDFRQSGEERALKIILNRFSENSFLNGEFSIILEDKSFDDELENLIKSRGKMFDLLIQSSPEPIFIYDTENLRFLEVNDAAVKLYGFKREEFLQMDLTDLYTPEDIQTLLDASNKEGVFSGPWRHRKKDGSSVFVELSKHSFKYNNTNAHFNFVKDVTEKLELEKDKKLFLNVFENSNDLLFVTDNTGFITRTNKSAFTLLGFTVDELENISFAFLLRDEERGKITNLLFHGGKNNVHDISIELKHKSGFFSEFTVTVIPFTNYNGEIEGYNLIAKQEKEEIVKEVVKEVYVEDKSGKKNGIANPQFFSNIFHEILTPINVILGFVQEINESINNPNEEQKEAVDIINQNRLKLLQTMNSIAEYSEIEQGSFELKTGSVSVTDIIDNLQEEVKLKGLNYGKISSSLKFITDKNKFQSFVNSFVKVAIGLSKEKKVYLSAFQYNTSHFAICVKDRTNGISDDLLKYLKMIFEKGDLSTTRDFGISKMLIKLTAKLAEVLQGEATVIEKGGAATEFGFVFPYDVSNIIINEEEVEKPIEVKPSEHEKYEAAENNVIPAMTENNILLQNYSSVESESANIVKQENSLAETTPLSEKGSLSLSSLSCLYIEDQTDSQILFKVQLKDLKDIKFAVSYEEALPLLQKYKFDFIVIDINLQGEYNGLDALKMIHRMPGYVSTPIVAVTAYVLPGDKDKFIAAGFIDFCAKPIFREKMIEILEKIYLK